MHIYTPVQIYILGQLSQHNKFLLLHCPLVEVGCKGLHTRHTCPRSLHNASAKKMWKSDPHNYLIIAVRLQYSFHSTRHYHHNLRVAFYQKIPEISR